MSIEAKHKDKLIALDSIETENDTLKKEILELETFQENETDIKKLLHYDSEIHKRLEIINQNKTKTKESYMLNFSQILSDFNKINDEESVFEKSNNQYFHNMLETRNVNNKGEMYNKYMDVIENVPIKQSSNSNVFLFCNNCGTPWTVSSTEALYICIECGEYESYFETSSTGMTYEQEITTDTTINFAYKRSDHLREILAQLQAKETSNIPDELLDSLRSEFKKARIEDLSEITQERVRFYLKKLKYNKYYENTRQITNILNGKPPPRLSEELYDKLINMFMAIQEPFEQVCPKGRKNFFSYNYILYKFCELLEEPEIMKLFPLLKSREKLYQQDCIWKQICEINEWPFYKSV